MRFQGTAPRLMYAAALMASLLPATPANTQSSSSKFYDPEPDKSWDKYILFHRKVFTDTDQIVNVIGGLTGEGLGLPNNTITIQCWKSRQTCTIAKAEEYGNRQVSDITLEEIDVTQWTPSSIVATQSMPCATVNITINRHTKDVSYVMTSGGYGSKSDFCANADSKTYVWHVTDPLGQQKLDQGAKVK